MNRLFTASSIDRKWYEEGEKPTSYQWRWGDHDRCRLPPMGICDDIRVVLDEGWIVTADVRGNYAGGAPIIFYDIEESKE